MLFLACYILVIHYLQNVKFDISDKKIYNGIVDYVYYCVIMKEGDFDG